MADNDILPATGDVIRSLDRQASGVKTQSMQVDVGGSSTNPEKLLTEDMLRGDAKETNELLFLMLLELEKITLLLTN